MCPVLLLVVHLAPNVCVFGPPVVLFILLELRTNVHCGCARSSRWCLVLCVFAIYWIAVYTRRLDRGAIGSLKRRERRGEERRGEGRGGEGRGGEGGRGGEEEGRGSANKTTVPDTWHGPPTVTK